MIWSSFGAALAHNDALVMNCNFVTVQIVNWGSLVDDDEQESAELRMRF